jgi:protein-tyrosine phosphatase
MDIFRINQAATLLVSGEIDDWERVRAQRVDTVIDMDGDVDFGLPKTPGAMLYVYYPIFDEDLPDLPKLDALGRMVAELIEAGRVVLVHCHMGFNRSMLVAATALSYLGLCGPDILAHMRQVRPGALFNERFAEHVNTLPARRIRLEVLKDPSK